MPSASCASGCKGSRPSSALWKKAASSPTTSSRSDHTGVYRRRILLDALDERTVAGEMEDDFHRFGVTLVHDGTRVVEMRGEGVRYPWTTCPDAVEPLRALAGAPLSTQL